jgi:hypothetical protein
VRTKTTVHALHIKRWRRRPAGRTICSMRWEEELRNRYRRSTWPKCFGLPAGQAGEGMDQQGTKNERGKPAISVMAVVLSPGLGTVPASCELHAASCCDLRSPATHQVSRPVASPRAVATTIALMATPSGGLFVIRKTMPSSTLT